MNDLRHDINEVFAKQQEQLGDVAGAGNRMLRAATAGRRVNAQLWRSVAGVALVLVAAAAVGTAVVIRGLNPRSVVTHHPSPTPIVTPSATPAPTPMSQPLNAPASAAVILFHDPVDSQQIDGTTWDGSAKGRVAAGTEFGNGFVQNPAGTLYGFTGYIRDRTGALVASPAVNTKGFPGTWADDGQHYCSMVSPSQLPPAGGEPATLQVTAVGQAPRNVVQVGRMYQQSGTGVAACSIDKDRAIVVHSGPVGNVVEFWVVQLSTGHILWTRPSGDIRASADGQYIAEMIYDQAKRTSTTTIYSPTGAVLGHVAGAVNAFSWDGSLAVVADWQGPVTVVRWRDGTVVWRGPSDGGFLGAMPEPGGQRIAVSVSDPQHPQTNGFYPGNVYVVAPDGQAVKLLTDVVL